MAEGGNDKPSMSWTASDLEGEWKRFRRHCEFTFKGPLANKTELEKVNYLMTYIGDKGREIYWIFAWAPAIPVKSTDFGGILPIFYLPTANLPIYHNLPISTDFFADLPNFNFF